jgi:methionyl-tRNA formyltransferase
MKIVFMGTPQAAVPCLERLLLDGHDLVAVYTQPDRPSGRGNRLTAPPVKEFAESTGLNVFQPAKIRSPEAVAFFRALAADVAVVVAYGRILPVGYLEAFPRGAINVHFSLLPKFRGAAPVNWAIVNGARETGVTTMRMDEGLDTGDILLQSRTAIGEFENSIELMSRLAIDGAALLSETLRRLDEIVPVPQDNAAASLAPIMSKEDGRIDWQRPAAEIANRVRGFQPFPTSFTFLREKKLTIWMAQAVEGEESRDAGAVLKAYGADLIVACGDGAALKIIELQIEGKRRMTARDFLNGVRIETGELLG